MKSLMKHLQRFLLSEEGPTAVEYAVMLALIILVCLAGVLAVGTKTNALFNSANSSWAAST